MGLPWTECIRKRRETGENAEWMMEDTLHMPDEILKKEEMRCLRKQCVSSFFRDNGKITQRAFHCLAFGMSGQRRFRVAASDLHNFIFSGSQPQFFRVFNGHDPVGIRAYLVEMVALMDMLVITQNTVGDHRLAVYRV